LKNKNLNVKKLRECLKTAWLGKKIYYFTEVDSTNNFAKKLAKQGAEEGAIVIAETQTSGRGRLGRRWKSPKGGIWLSIILKPKLELKEIIKVNLLAAVAVSKTIGEELKLTAEVKWPNDVLINRKKVCGILAETVSEKDKAKYVIVGIGVNANFDLSALPEELRTTASSLKEILGMEIDRERFICSLLKNFEFYYEAIKEENFKLILNYWRSLSCLLGCRVRIYENGEKYEALATDIDENGYLIVKLDDGTVKKIFSADVTLKLSG